MAKLEDDDLLNKSNGLIFDKTTYHKIKPEDYGITDYKWNDENGLLDCFQDVKIIKSNSMVRVPFNFGEIHGNFVIHNPDNIKLKPNTVFKSFKGGPRKIFGNFCCDNLGLVNMNHFPETVTGYISAEYNNFISFKGCQQKITKFYIDDIRRQNLVYGPKECDFYSIRLIPDALEYYPICIIHDALYIDHVKNDWCLSDNFEILTELVKANKDIFRPLLDDKVKFHQQVMRMIPELIPHYTAIKPPTSKTII